MFCKHKWFSNDKEIKVSAGDKFVFCKCVHCGKEATLSVFANEIIFDSLNIKEVLRMENENYQLVSDGYHTFDELYRHRMILFACLCANNYRAWKSKLHHDGTMYDNYFIVGIDTEFGSTSYHYHIENWDFFKCEEVEKAPAWDGHTSKDVLERLTKEYLGV